MKQRKRAVAAVVAATLLVTSTTADAAEDGKLGAPNGAAGDAFGFSVAHDGSRVVVGAPGVDTGVFDTDVGSVYVFDATTGALVRELLPARATERRRQDAYGQSVASNGRIIAVGSPLADDIGIGPAAGEVFVFNAANGRQRAKLLPIDTRRSPAGGDFFGFDIDMSDTHIVVGAPGTISPAPADVSGVGAVYIYDARTLRRITRVIPRQAGLADNVGRSVAVAGRTVLAGAPFDDTEAEDAGAVYVLNASNGRQRTILTASDGDAEDLFGLSVDTDGTFIAVGSPFDDDLGDDSGSVYLFEAATGAFVRKIVPADGGSGDQFGISLDIADGKLAVGAWGDNDGAGSVYVFDLASGNQLDKLVASDAAALDILGRSVALSGSTVVAGAPNDDDQGTDSGSVYSFSQSVS